MTTPPNIGDTGWGTELNNYLTDTLQAEADNTATAFSVHISAAPGTATAADPHGDQAYARSLMSPVLNGLNQPNGLAQLDANGLVPAALIPASTFTESGVQVLSNGNTIVTTGNTPLLPVSEASSVTGISLGVPTAANSQVTVINRSNFTITFAASGSNVADGSSDVIPALTARMFTYDGGTTLWYRAA